MAKILHASIDENKKAKNGKAGDQTGKEVCIANFDANRGWAYVLRADLITRKKMIEAGKKLCICNLVGYDQNQRNTLHTELLKHNYNVDKYIASKVKTETDCSAFMTVLSLIAGIRELEYKTNAPTTSTMIDKFMKTGKFVKVKYVAGMKLFQGDILVKPGSHTVMYIG